MNGLQLFARLQEIVQLAAIALKRKEKVSDCETESPVAHFEVSTL